MQQFHTPIPKLIFPKTRLTGFDEPREDLVKAYGIWQRCHVSEKQKGFCDQLQHLTLHHGYDLEIIAHNQKHMVQIYLDCDVPEAFVCRFVYDVMPYIEQRQQAKNS